VVMFISILLEERQIARRCADPRRSRSSLLDGF